MIDHCKGIPYRPKRFGAAMVAVILGEGCVRLRCSQWWGPAGGNQARLRHADPRYPRPQPLVQRRSGRDDWGIAESPHPLSVAHRPVSWIFPSRAICPYRGYSRQMAIWPFAEAGLSCLAQLVDQNALLSLIHHVIASVSLIRTWCQPSTPIPTVKVTWP